MARKAYKQGIFKPQNPEKYVGTHPILFRSQLEFLFNRWADLNENVLQWGSESIVIPYTSPKDGRTHRYYVDAVLVLKTPKGNKKFLVEIKPEKFTKPPKNIGRKSKKNLLFEQIQYAVNCEKWKSAEDWCKKNDFEFVILTEKDLK